MKKKGTGISLGVHPSGLKGGGDPSQAQIRLKPDGTLDLMNGAVDIGQGCKTVLRQIAADTLGVPLESITTITLIRTSALCAPGRLPAV